MQIPKQVTVGNKPYYFVQKPATSYGLYGSIQYGNATIIVHTQDKKGRPIKQCYINETFWHELTHAILYEMDERKLAFNERFVKEFGYLLSKAVDSARF